MDKPQNSAQRHLTLLAAGLVLVAFSVAFVDRGASSWSHAHLRGIVFFQSLTHIVDPIQPAAVIGLIAAGVAFCAGWRPGEKGMTLIAACLAVLVSFEIKDGLKFAFGRTWPETWVDHNPSWIGSGAYGFHPFHGREGWASFPSGHMTQVTTLAAVLWRRVRPLRWAWAGIALLVAIGLFGADYHFIGDMIAGTFLGAACGSGVVAILFRSQAGRQNQPSL
jgi:membrane-associated phospholipid phosphatase